LRATNYDSYNVHVFGFLTVRNTC